MDIQIPVYPDKLSEEQAIQLEIAHLALEVERGEITPEEFTCYTGIDWNRYEAEEFFKSVKE
jgi:hypothetical protein